MSTQTLKLAIKQRFIPLINFLLERLPPSQVNTLLQERAERRKTPAFFFEYPWQIKPRWTAKSPHPQILQVLDKQQARYAETLQSYLKLIPQLEKIPFKSSDPRKPEWWNGWIPALDAISIYAEVALQKPARFLEVGSGSSTKFACQAKEDFQLDTEIVSIDPHPRSEIDSICDCIVRTGLEGASLKLFEELQAGDVVYVDNSHRALMNSDATVFFLDVLPRLKKGVRVGIHDIFWPLDYPEAWVERYYSEQYLLGQYLMLAKDLKIILPGAYVSTFPKVEMAQEILKPLWAKLPEGIEKIGAAFWFEVP